MNSAIDNWNYANDARTQGPAKAPVLSFYGCGTCGTPGEGCDCPAAPDGVDPVQGTHFYGTEIEEKLPTRWGVCPVCDGNGSHVNPSIDAGGLTSEDFCEDFEFGEAYMDGVYDVTCNRCEGKRVVPVVNFDAMPKWQQDEYAAQERAEADCRAEELAEIRAGC